MDVRPLAGRVWPMSRPAQRQVYRARQRRPARVLPACARCSPSAPDRWPCRDRRRTTPVIWHRPGPDAGGRKVAGWPSRRDRQCARPPATRRRVPTASGTPRRTPSCRSARRSLPRPVGPVRARPARPTAGRPCRHCVWRRQSPAPPHHRVPRVPVMAAAGRAGHRRPNSRRPAGSGWRPVRAGRVRR